MPLIPQQSLVVINGPYNLGPGQSSESVAAELLRARLEAFPPCRIVSISGINLITGYSLTAVVETI